MVAWTVIRINPNMEPDWTTLKDPFCQGTVWSVPRCWAGGEPEGCSMLRETMLMLVWQASTDGTLHVAHTLMIVHASSSSLVDMPWR